MKSDTNHLLLLHKQVHDKRGVEIWQKDIPVHYQMNGDKYHLYSLKT